MKEKSKVFELREKLQVLEKNLAKEKSRGKEPSAIQALDQETKKIQEEIGVAEAEQRKIQREPLIEKLEAVLVELQRKALTQLEQWDRLKKISLLADDVENLLGARRAWKRVDFVQCRVVDPKWRERKLPHVSTISRFPNQPLAEIGSSVDKRFRDGDVYELLPYQRAVEFEAQGRVEIVKEGDPQFQEQVVADPRPKALDMFTGIDLGLPIEINGDFLPEFQSVTKEIGFFRLNYLGACNLIKSQKLGAGKKK
jgi:hypothetical protein